MFELSLGLYGFGMYYSIIFYEVDVATFYWIKFPFFCKSLKSVKQLFIARLLDSYFLTTL